MVLTTDSLLDRLNAVTLEHTGDMYRLAFFAMGTECQVTFSAVSRAAADRFRLAAFQWLAGFEATFSRFLPDSLISQLNREAGGSWIPVTEEAEAIFKLCDWYVWVTRGLFDPTALPLLRLWDYKAEFPRLPAPDEVRAAKALVGWKRVERRAGEARLPAPGMAIDLGGIGKEYAVDRVMGLAMTHGITDALVDFGHDIRVMGKPPGGDTWMIGLEDPRDPGLCWTGVALRDRAVCASGNYLRRVVIDGVSYGHIVDPRTGRPVSHDILSAAVIAPTCTEAGILSTCAFILGSPEGVEFIDAFHQAEGCLCGPNNHIVSRGFHAYVS